MGQEGTGYHGWTEEELVRETVSNFESLDPANQYKLTAQIADESLSSELENMADKKPKKDASPVLVGARERTLASAVRRRASAIYSLDLAFEQAGCSCSPYRRQLKELETRYRAERDRLMYELENSNLAREMGQLRKTIAGIDGREHSSLDVAARQAYPFLPVWMLNQVMEGNSDVLGMSDPDIADSYADAWYGGWRPKSLNKPKGSGVDG